MKSIPFSEAFRDLTSKYSKIPKSKFLESGSFPIIDQGRGKTAGYFHDVASAVDNGEVVIFGDHTRAVKFADGPFALGADGTKVLKPVFGLFPRYAYRWLQAQEVTSLGYSRHFKLLKELSVPVCDEEEQRRIAEILDKADVLRAKRRETIDYLDDLGQSIFHKMFAGLSGDSVTLRDSSLRFVGGRNMVGAGVNAHPTKKVLKVNAASSGEFDGSQVKPLPLDYDPPAEHRVVAGDLIVTRASGTKSLIGVATLVDFVPSETYLPDKLWKAITNPELLHAEYFRFLTRSTAYRKYVSNAASGAAGVNNISQAKLLDFRLVLPPIELQKAFAYRIAAIESLKTTYRTQLIELDNLFLSLQDRAFKGEL